jgi:hypothetical protein
MPPHNLAVAPCYFCDHGAVTNLDGSNLCQLHADQWVRAEGYAEQERLRDEREARGETL